MFKYEKQAVVVHGFFGIGTVDSVETRRFLDTESEFVSCRFPQTEGNDVKLLVNPRFADRLIRPLMEPGQIPLVWEHLEQYEPGPPMRYNVRNRYFESKLKAVELLERCELVKEFYSLARKQPLGKKEQEMFKLARGVLVDELTLVSGNPRDKVEAKEEALCCA